MLSPSFVGQSWQNFALCSVIGQFLKIRFVPTEL